MKLSKIALTAIIAATVAVPALAVDSYEPVIEGPYLTIDAGANFIMDNATVVTPLGNGDLKFDTGWRADLILGYHLNRFAAVEVEGGFMHNEFENSSDWYGAVPVLGNIVFRYENDSHFVPYIGAGAGAAWTMIEGDNLDSKDWVFAYQGKAGIAWKVTPSMLIDVGYKFLGTGDQNFGGVTFKNVCANYAGVSLTFRF